MKSLEDKKDNIPKKDNIIKNITKEIIDESIDNLDKSKTDK